MIDNQLAAVAKFCRERNGAFSLGFGLRGGPHWSAMLNFGEETPGSEMAAGSILGSGSTPEECLASLIDEGKIEVADAE